MTDHSTVTGAALRERLAIGQIFSSIGIVNQNCAAIVDEFMPADGCGYFLSGLSRTYTELGLPDEGNITAKMMVDWARNIKAIYPERHMIVDIDEGLGPMSTSLGVLRDLRGLASAVQFDDQDPTRRRCGHLDGKVVVPLAEYTAKLGRFLNAVGDDILVIARTDSPDFADALRRAKTFSEMGAPIVLVDGLAHPEKLAEVRDVIRPDTALMFNYIQGGRSAPLTATELRACGGNIFNFSFPFMLEQMAVTRRIVRQIVAQDGYLPVGEIGLRDAVAIMQRNFEKIQTRNGMSAATPRDQSLRSAA